MSAAERPWWASADGDGTVGAEDPLDAHRAGRAGGSGPAGRHGHAHGAVEACHICPVCAGIRILGEARPELVAHLSEAARHLTLAAKAFVDAQAEGIHRDDGLERIDLDDE